MSSTVCAKCFRGTINTDKKSIMVKCSNCDIDFFVISESRVISKKDKNLIASGKRRAKKLSKDLEARINSGFTKKAKKTRKLSNNSILTDVKYREVKISKKKVKRVYIRVSKKVRDKNL